MSFCICILLVVIMNMKSNDKIKFKIIIIGTSGSGKTSILKKFADNEFNTSHASTIGVDFRHTEMTIDGQTYSVQIWDTAGQDRFKSITRSFYTQADGVIIVYDITTKETFDQVAVWMEDIVRYNQKEELPKILIGNKVDLSSKRKISFSEGKSLANKLGVDFFESSAKTNVNITEVFEKIVLLMDEVRKKNVKKKQEEEIKKQEEDKKNNKSFKLMPDIKEFDKMKLSCC